MAKSRDTVTYELRDGRKKVYVGTTNNPERREAQHRADGKNFTSMNVTSRKMTDEGAKRRESDQLASYRKGHGGSNPRYNKDSDG